MEIARSNPLSIGFSFDPKSLLRQIVEVLAREFRGAPDHDRVRMAQVPSLPTYGPHAGRRASAYAPRWG